MSMFMKIIFLIILTIKFSNPLKQNVLFIVVDDLRPFLGAYDYKNAYTPNIDLLAQKSIVFNNAYAQQAICAPSRNSFLTSRRPDTLKLYDFYSYWRDFAGNFTTLPQHFKENGYHTVSIGKVFHPGISSNFDDDFKYSWSEKPYHPPTEIYKQSKVCPTKEGPLAKNLICPVIVDEQPGGNLPDLESLEAALQFLEDYNNPINSNISKKPYFLAVGFHKPHIPLKYPVEYLDLHPLENVTLPNNRVRPSNLPGVAWNPFTDLRERDDIAKLNLSFPFGEIPDEVSRRIIQSYNAAISYMDDLVGQLLKKIDKNTIIVLVGDHGWSLSEHGEFSKFSNFEVAVRVPLIIHVPNLTNNKKKIVSDSLVELVDIFPTLVDLTQVSRGLQTCPDEKTILCTEGKSLVPALIAAIQNKTFEGKSAVFNQYPRPGLFPTLKPNSDKPKLREINIMGYSIRTQQYRYTEWVKFNHKKILPNWSKVYAKELYDYSIENGENFNFAGRPEMLYVEQELSRKLRLGWRYV